MMASTKKSAPKAKQSQAQRLLEATRKARVETSGGKFAQAMGKATLAKQGRKPTKMG